MTATPNQILRQNKGLTYTNLMITTALLALLSSIAIPSFTTYLLKARVSAVQGMADNIQDAMTGYASDTLQYPLMTDIGESWEELRTLLNEHGATLDLQPKHIVAYDYQSDEEGDNYTLKLMLRVPTTIKGHTFEITQGGVTRVPGVSSKEAGCHIPACRCQNWFRRVFGGHCHEDCCPPDQLGPSGQRTKHSPVRSLKPSLVGP